MPAPSALNHIAENICSINTSKKFMEWRMTTALKTSTALLTVVLGHTGPTLSYCVTVKKFTKLL